MGKMKARCYKGGALRGRTVTIAQARWFKPANGLHTARECKRGHSKGRRRWGEIWQEKRSELFETTKTLGPLALVAGRHQMG